MLVEVQNLGRIVYEGSNQRFVILIAVAALSPSLSKPIALNCMLLVAIFCMMESRYIL